MGLFKRGSVWWMRFSYRGKLVRQSTETDDKRLAQKIYYKAKGQATEGKWFDKPKDRGFKELVEKYMSEAISERSRSSCESYLKRLVEFFGDCRLSELTANRVNELKTYFKARGEAVASINMKLKILKRMFNLASKDWEWLDRNPIASVSLLPGANKRTRWLTSEEEGRIFHHSPPWLKEINLFALHTGCRLGEILSLSWGEVNLFARTILIATSKNNEPRTIPMNQIIFDLLKEKSKIRSIQDGRVFPFKKCAVQYRFRLASERARVEDIHFHDLRHSFGSRLVQAGVDLYRVQKLLGHKSPLMTQRYAHLSIEALKPTVEALVAQN